MERKNDAMDKSPKTLVALSLGALMATTTLACKDPEIKAGNRATRTVEASISTFDPDADVVLDLDPVPEVGLLRFALSTLQRAGFP